MDIKNFILCYFIIIGSVSIFFLFLYFIFYKNKNKKVDPVINIENMPKLIPLPIPTKNIKNPFKRILTWIFEVRQWELIEDWDYKLDEDTILIVPKGYKFDGASIPKMFWSILSPVGLLLIPALIHDYGYQYNYLRQKTNYKDKVGKIIYMKYPKNFEDIKNKRKYWDDLFFRMSMDVNGVWLISVIAWAGVRVGGWKPWNDCKRSIIPIFYFLKK